MLGITYAPIYYLVQEAPDREGIVHWRTHKALDDPEAIL